MHEENLRANLVACRLENQQVQEQLKITKRNHVQLLKDKSEEKRNRMWKWASRDIAVMDSNHS